MSMENLPTPPCRMYGAEEVYGTSTWQTWGYIIVSIENRGANAPRGREWRKCIYGEVGTFASEDQARGIQDLARQYSSLTPHVSVSPAGVAEAARR